MKNLIIIYTLLLSVNSFAQSKQKAEKALLKKLNFLYADTKAEDEGIGFPDKKTIIAPFAINKEGILSVAVKRINDDGSSEISKMEVPMNKLKEVLYDMYLILLFEKDTITWATYEPDEKTIKETSKSTMLHIGIPLPEDESHQIKLQQLVNGVLQFYK